LGGRGGPRISRPFRAPISTSRAISGGVSSGGGRTRSGAGSPTSRRKPSNWKGANERLSAVRAGDNGKPDGLAINIGARVAASAAPRELLVSSTVKDLTAGSGLVFEDAGQHELKGIPEPWRLYRVLSAAVKQA